MFAAGVPAVSTDVGSCRQLVEGLDGVDLREIPQQAREARALVEAAPDLAAGRPEVHADRIAVVDAQAPQYGSTAASTALSSITTVFKPLTI